MAPTPTMKAELSALKPSELSKRAVAEGVAQADIDKALDSDNTKEQLSDLIVRHAAARDKSKKRTKARRSKDGELSAGQACCVVFCTVLALAASFGAVCTFSDTCYSMYVLLAATGAGIEGPTYHLPSDGDGPQVLTADTFGGIVSETAQSGQTLVVEFFAPWCGHCKKLAPVWARFADDVALDPKHSNTLTVAQLDCTANMALCKQQGVEGFPTIKYYNAETTQSGSVYEGGRESVAQLLSFAESLGPQCSHSHMDLCSESELEIIDGHLKRSAEERKDLLDSAEAAMQKINDDFHAAVEDLNARVRAAEKERDEIINYYHDNEFALLQTIAREDTELFNDLYPDSSLEIG